MEHITISHLRGPLIALALGIIPFFLFIGAQQSLSLNEQLVEESSINLAGIALGALGLLIAARSVWPIRQYAKTILSGTAIVVCSVQIVYSAGFASLHQFTTDPETRAAREQAKASVEEQRAGGATTLRLTDMDALDELPEGLADAPGFGEVVLVNLGIDDLMPLTEIDGLRTLQLHHLPSVSADALGAALLDMPDLEALHLADMSHIGCLPEQIADIETPRQMFIRGNPPCLSPLSQDRALKNLQIGWSLEPVDLSPLEGHPELEALYLEQVDAGRIDALASMSQLHFLGLVNSTVDDLTPLAEIASLRALHITDHVLSGSDLASISQINGLEELVLDDSEIDSLEPISEMSNLQRLSLRGTPIEDISPLSDMTGLTLLDISFTPVTDLSPISELPDLKHVRAFRTEIENTAGLEGRDGFSLER